MRVRVRATFSRASSKSERAGVWVHTITASHVDRANTVSPRSSHEMENVRGRGLGNLPEGKVGGKRQGAHRCVAACRRTTPACGTDTTARHTKVRRGTGQTMIPPHTTYTTHHTHTLPVRPSYSQRST